MSGRQEKVFLNGEADQWYERNKEKLNPREDDFLAKIIERLQLRPKRILEIGASNGYRLQILHRMTGAACTGIEPSTRAVEDGRRRFPDIKLDIGTADVLPYEDASFDIIIFGFCFYLIDPALHFQVVREADRVLKNKGFLLIWDFQSRVPYHNQYVHKEGVKSYKMEFSRYFLAHPGYTLVHRELLPGIAQETHPDERIGVDVLLKDFLFAFPGNPFQKQTTERAP